MKKQTKCVDDITFELKSDFDFSWLSKYGRVFCVFDQQDSGNICFGVEQNGQKLFIKYAGAPTINYQGENGAAISRMKEAMLVYKDLSHPNLIKLVKHGEEGMGYASIYEWVEGECLHAHWNFEQMPKYTHPKSPNVRFGKLELDKKLNCLDAIYKLHLLVAEKGFIAVDFYDGSIIYDFDKDKTTICDIDFYVKGAFVNTMGEDLWDQQGLNRRRNLKKGPLLMKSPMFTQWER